MNGGADGIGVRIGNLWPAGQHLVAGLGVLRTRMDDGSKLADLVHLAGHAREVFADGDTWEVGWDGLELTADLAGSLRFHVEGVDGADPAIEPEQDGRPWPWDCQSQRWRQPVELQVKKGQRREANRAAERRVGCGLHSCAGWMSRGSRSWRDGCFLQHANLSQSLSGCLRSRQGNQACEVIGRNGGPKPRLRHPLRQRK